MSLFSAKTTLFLIYIYINILLSSFCGYGEVRLNNRKVKVRIAAEVVLGFACQHLSEPPLSELDVHVLPASLSNLLLSAAACSSATIFTRHCSTQAIAVIPSSRKATASRREHSRIRRAAFRHTIELVGFLVLSSAY